MVKRIALVRASRGLSQSDLAQKIHITRTQLSHYESGRLHVSADILGRLSIELKTTVDFWLYATIREVLGTRT